MNAVIWHIVYMWVVAPVVGWCLDSLKLRVSEKGLGKPKADCEA